MAMARAYMQLDNWFKAVQHTNRALDDATPEIRDQVFLWWHIPYKWSALQNCLIGIIWY